jgi:peroxiredoxin
MSKIVFIASVLSMALLFGCVKSEMRIDGVASDFSLKDLSGKTVKLSDFKGKPVLLDFWATWCQPCRDSIRGIQKLHTAYSAKGLVVLGISLDQGGWDGVKSFADERGITYTVLKGDEDIVSKYQVRAIPMLVILNKEGKIVKRYLGGSDDDELDKEIKALL